MKAIFWKEWRENWKWAALAMLTLAGAEFYGFLKEETYRTYDVDGLLKPAFLLVTVFGHAAAGFLLGLVQFLPELKRDRWAMLLHRPAPRSALYLGKIGAGLALYAVAAVPPLVASAAYAAHPGHFGYPFVPGMIRPAAADAATGLVYYFAAVFLALEPRWALRILALLAALHISRFTQETGSFRAALEAVAAMALALGVAAWTLIRDPNGAFAARSRTARLALLGVLFYGACQGGHLLQNARSLVHRQNNGSFVYYDVTDEGQPVRLSSGLKVTITTLDGQPLTDPRYKGINRYQHLLGFHPVTLYLGDDHGLPRQFELRDYRESSTYARPIGMAMNETWFYLPDRRVFLGFNRKRELSASADGSGFHSPETPPQSLPLPIKLAFSDRENPVPLRSGSTIDVFDFEGHQLIELPLSHDDSLFGLSDMGRNLLGIEPPHRVVIALGDHLLVYDLTYPNKPLVIPYPHDVNRWGMVMASVDKTGSRYYFHYQPSVWLKEEEKRKMPSYLDEVDAQGHVLHSYVLPPQPIQKRPHDYIGEMTGALEPSAFFLGEAVYKRVCDKLHIVRYGMGIEMVLGGGRNHLIRSAWHIGLASLLFSGIAWVWARRRHFEARSARRWACFVFAFGLPGLIAFRLAADWPVEIACQACGRKRPVDRETCPACAAAWPTPAPDGTEIFDSVPG